MSRSSGALDTANAAPDPDHRALAIRRSRRRRSTCGSISRCDRHRERLARLAGFEAAARGSEAGCARRCSRSRTLTCSRSWLRARSRISTRATASASPTAPSPRPRAAGVLPGHFAAAARRAREAGFDCVELHFAHAYTMASFLSRLNTRDDGYGGTLANACGCRSRSSALCGARSAKTTPSLPDPADEGSRRQPGRGRFLLRRRLARAGIGLSLGLQGREFEDAKQPKVGEAIYPYPSERDRVHADGPESTRAVRSAEICSCRPQSAARSSERGLHADRGRGRLNSFELAETALREGACDFVASARQSLPPGLVAQDRARPRRGDPPLHLHELL